TYGQVFAGWAEAIRAADGALRTTEAELRVVGLGGTAVGTGLTAHPRFRVLVVRELSRITGRRLRPAPSAATATWSLRPTLACSGALRALAVDLGKICFDLRLLASGPAAGLGELRLPEVEPGSSIMPGKVNPSVAEAVQMACFQVAANDHAIALAAAAGALEVTVMTPSCATNLPETLELLARAPRVSPRRARATAPSAGGSMRAAPSGISGRGSSDKSACPAARAEHTSESMRERTSSRASARSRTDRVRSHFASADRVLIMMQDDPD